MAREISTTDTQDGVVERDGDGEIIPEKHTVELPDGEEVFIKTKPITTGVLNEISHIDEEVMGLEPKAVKEAFETVYLSDALTSMTVEEIRDTRGAYLKAYLTPLEEAVGESFDEEDDEGNLAEMDRRERAEKMR